MAAALSLHLRERVVLLHLGMDTSSSPLPSWRRLNCARRTCNRRYRSKFAGGRLWQPTMVLTMTEFMCPQWASCALIAKGHTVYGA